MTPRPLRLPVRATLVAALLLLLRGAPATAQTAAPAGTTSARELRVVRLLGTLAADSMEGRATGTEGSARAARFLAAELARYGVEPAGDDGFFQTVPLVRGTGPNGGASFALLAPGTDPSTVDPARLVAERNVVGLIRGGDPALRDEVIVLGAHFDHVGVGPAVDGDSIYNGADDDGSGTVAVLEIARELAAGPPPGRSVLVLLTTGEEVGLLGTRWYLDHPVIPLERTVADLQIEMIGRPDALAGGPGRGWLTGYERSTLGDVLRDAGAPIVPDPRPDQRFFFRSDNIAFAYRGIPAHTLSSFGLHGDYHQPSDEVERVDGAHMAAIIDAAAAMVRSLSLGPRPRWHPGGQPTPPGGR